MTQSTEVRMPPGGLFVALVYACSWGLWLPMVLSGELNSALLIAGCCVPSVLGIAFAMLAPPEPRREFWRRAFDPRPITGRWLAIALLVIPGITALAFLLARLRGAEPPSLGNLLATLTDPRLLGSLVAIQLVGGPLAQEFGWRGYLLDRFQQHWPPLEAALVLGCIWATWHLPTFFIPGTVQAGLGFPSWGLLLFYLQILALALIIHSAYNGCRRSILVAILIHFTFNLSWSILPGPGQPLSLALESARAMLLLLLAFNLVVRFRRLPSKRFPRGLRGV